MEQEQTRNPFLDSEGEEEQEITVPGTVPYQPPRYGNYPTEATNPQGEGVDISDEEDQVGQRSGNSQQQNVSTQESSIVKQKEKVEEDEEDDGRGGSSSSANRSPGVVSIEGGRDGQKFEPMYSFTIGEATRVSGDSALAGYTSYGILVQKKGEEEYKIERRFNDFQTLARHLSVLYKYKLFPPPPPTAALTTSRFDEDLILSRKKHFANYLSHLAKVPFLSLTSPTPNPFLSFIAPGTFTPPALPTPPPTPSTFSKLTSLVSSKNSEPPAMTQTEIDEESFWKLKLKQVEDTETHLKKMITTVQNLAQGEKSIFSSYYELGLLYLNNASNIEQDDKEERRVGESMEVRRVYVDMLKGITGRYEEKLEREVRECGNAKSVVGNRMRESERVRGMRVGKEVTEERIKEGKREVEEGSRELKRELGEWEKKRKQRLRKALVEWVQGNMNVSVQSADEWKKLLVFLSS